MAEAVPLFWRFVVEKFGVPHVGSPEFDREAHHQSAAVAASAHASDDQAFIDAVSLDDE